MLSFEIVKALVQPVPITQVGSRCVGLYETRGIQSMKIDDRKTNRSIDKIS